LIFQCAVWVLRTGFIWIGEMKALFNSLSKFINCYVLYVTASSFWNQ
jgi:hypothetical protein